MVLPNLVLQLSAGDSQILRCFFPMVAAGGQGGQHLIPARTIGTLPWLALRDGEHGRLGGYCRAGIRLVGQHAGGDAVGWRAGS